MSPIKEYYRQYSGMDEECQCLQCGDLFKARGSWALYCSLRCKNDAAIQRRRNIKAPPPPKKCIVCDRSFDSRRNDKKYCGNACKQKHYRTTPVTNPNAVTAPPVTHTVKQRKPYNTMVPLAWHQRISIDTIYKVKYLLARANAEMLQLLEDGKISVNKAHRIVRWMAVEDAIELYQVSNNEDDK